MTLNELSVSIHKTAKSNGFYDNKNRRFPEVLTLAHSELSEAFEAWRDEPDNPYFLLGDKPEGWAAELIDCIIVCLDILGAHKMDADTIMKAKMEYNEFRPTRHGRGI